MTENELNELGEILKSDPNIQEALSEHEKACQDNEEDNCVVCQTRKALSHLMFVKQSIDENTCDCEQCAEDPVSELDIAYSLVDNLEGGLQLISVCQQAISFLSDLTNAAAFIIAQNELHDHDHDHDDPDVYDEEEDGH